MDTCLTPTQCARPPRRPIGAARTRASASIAPENRELGRTAEPGTGLLSADRPRAEDQHRHQPGATPAPKAARRHRARPPSTRRRRRRSGSAAAFPATTKACQHCRSRQAARSNCSASSGATNASSRPEAEPVRKRILASHQPSGSGVVPSSSCDSSVPSLAGLRQRAGPAKASRPAAQRPTPRPGAMLTQQIGIGTDGRAGTG